MIQIYIGIIYWYCLKKEKRIIQNLPWIPNVSLVNDESEDTTQADKTLIEFTDVMVLVAAMTPVAVFKV